MLYLCNVIQKEKSHTDLTDPTDLLRCKQRFSLCLTGKNSEGVKIREIREIRVGKQKLREETKIRSIREIRVQESGTAQRPLNINH